MSHYNFFSDKRLLDLKFTRSQHLHSYVYGEVGNPILRCIVNNSELLGSYDNEFGLFNDIIEALENKKIDWPKDFSLMSCEQWIKKTRDNASFYFHPSQIGIRDVEKCENLLIDLVSQTIEKDIKLIPFFEEDHTVLFRTSSFSTMTPKPIFLLSSQKFWDGNFFMSIYPKHR